MILPKVGDVFKDRVDDTSVIVHSCNNVVVEYRHLFNDAIIGTSLDEFNKQFQFKGHATFSTPKAESHIMSLPEVLRTVALLEDAHIKAEWFSAAHDIKLYKGDTVQANYTALATKERLVCMIAFVEVYEE